MRIPIPVHATPGQPVKASAHAPIPASVDSAATIWQTATGVQRETALKRELFLQPVIELIDSGVAPSVAIRNVLTRLQCRLYPQRQLDNARILARGEGIAPSRSSIFDWLAAYRQQGRAGLLPRHKGRTRRDYGWEALAVALYNRPSKPSFASVAHKLREEHGFENADYVNVRRYLQSLPATLNDNSPARLGAHFHRQNRRGYVRRDAEVLLVGEVYQGDGHTVDAYVAHPNTGKPFRPELTVWIDVRSRYLVGWYLSDAESALSTLFALSHALVEHDHVPAWLHIDNGSGYRAKLMSAENTGFYSRFSITPSFAIPGNSKGKGLIEHWFRIFRDHHDKHFNGGRDYCGADMASEINRRLGDQLQRGRRTLCSLAEYTTSVATFVEHYNHRPNQALAGIAPVDVWKQLEPVPIELPAAAVVRPMERRTAQREMVQLHNRYYEHPLLLDYHGREVNVEYDIHCDDRVWIYDDRQRLICEARLKAKVDWLPQSRLDEARRKREQGRIARLQKKIALVRAEEANCIDHTDALAALEKFDALDAAPAPARSRITLDITTDDYLHEE